ncbi:MAG: glycosyltransferase [Bacteroidales bacterium]|nr:glycosyltransferase [Bacteroidales bacterium]MCF8389634.1 glycosyltransferase [Bacteroidales bacterium]
MKVLIVCSGNKGKLSPFIQEQLVALQKAGADYNLFLIKKAGFGGYLSHLPSLNRSIKEYKPDIIHAHYGLSGLLANFQRKLPVVTTFHGSDINEKKLLKYSRLAHHFSAASIFVSEKMKEKVKDKGNSFVIPCGVELSTFVIDNKVQKHISEILEKGSFNILFSSSFSNPVKNAKLAIDGCKLVEKIKGVKMNLIELKGYSREEVNQLMNPVDLVLMTSYSEGSPQFIKEAMACNKPIVSTDVGDIRWLFGGSEGHFISSFEASNVAENIGKAIVYSNEKKTTHGRQRIIDLGLDSESIAKSIIAIYCKVLKAY